MSEGKPVELTEAQKADQEKVAKFRKDVETFVWNKSINDFEFWYNTRNIIQNPMKLEVVAGKTFEPHVKDSMIWVGALWELK